MIQSRYLAAMCVLLLIEGCRKEVETPKVADAAPVAVTAPAAPASEPVRASEPVPVPEPAPAEATAPAPDPSVLRASFTKCIDDSGAVDAAMQECIANEFGYHDERLNLAYATLKQTLAADKMAELRGVQRNWLRDRDTKCAWDARTEGSAQRLQANYCMMEVTAKRANELEALAHSDE
jgi:uncharacterized protein YecT (DUF1311 family)